MSNVEKTLELQRRRRELADGKSAAKAKSAHDKIRDLFDEGSFIELGGFVTDEAESEGVVTGYGTVDERLVYAYAQSADAIGAVSAGKIAQLLDMAVKMGAPVVSVLGASGVRIGEGPKALAGLGRVLSKTAALSGVVPHISLVTGPCAGSAALTAALADFAILAGENSVSFLSGPVAASQADGGEVGTDALGGPVAASRYGISALSFAGETDGFAAVKRILSFLPSNNLEYTPLFPPTDDAGRATAGILGAVAEGGAPFDMTAVIREIADLGDFFEVYPGFAKNILTGFITLNGTAAGVVASQPLEKDGLLDTEAVKKAARFIRICDSFQLPLLSLIDTPGFAAGAQQEHGQLAAGGAALLAAYAEATVPKVSLIVRRAYGSAYLSMGAKEVGADLVLAYPFAEISLLHPEAAATLLYSGDLANADDPVAARKEMINRFRDSDASPYTASENGVVDDIIDPGETRQRLIGALEMLESKRDERIAKKHGNLPV